jgi:CRISPR/Cas system-associated exonuclease Cas4 (RecB family)
MVLMVDEYMDSTEAETQESGDGYIKWRHDKDRVNVRNFCVELCKRLEPILLEKVVPFDYEPAKRFKIPITLPGLDNEKLPVFLTGEFDLLVRDDNQKFHVWDLKATADNSYWKKTLGQLVFYDLAVFAMMGETPISSGLIQPMCDERILEFTFTDEDRRAMFSRVMAMMRAVWEGDHQPKKDSAGCYSCSVKSACSKYNTPSLI